MKSGDLGVSTIPKYELDNKKELLKSIAEEENVTAGKSRCFSLLRGSFLDCQGVCLPEANLGLCRPGVSKDACRNDFHQIWQDVRLGSVVMDTELNDNIHMGLPLIQNQTLTVVISFPDYYFMTEKIAEYAKSKGSHVIAITDSKEAAITRFSDDVLTVPSHTRLFLNTLSIPMGLLNVLTSAIDIEKNFKGKGKEAIGSLGSYFQEKSWWKLGK